MKKGKGMLKVLSELPVSPTGNRVPMVRCKCECGRKVTISKQQLEVGLRVSCGCRTKKIIARYQANAEVILRDKDLPDSPPDIYERQAEREIEIGDQFGELKITDYAGVSGKRYHLFSCKCACKGRRIVHGIDLLSGIVNCCLKCEIKREAE